MKKVTLLSALIVLFSTGSYGQKENTKWLKEGTTLIYTVDNDYDFTLNVTKLGPDIEFNWTMNKGTRSGTVKMTSDAISNATTQNNYFSSGTEVYNNKTTVWVSDYVYKGLSDNKPVEINPGNSRQQLSLTAREKMTIKINGQDVTLNVLHATTDQGKEYWIWDNPKNPLILRMKLEFEINIYEVKY